MSIYFDLYSIPFYDFQLSPTDRSIHTDWENELDEAKEYVRKLNVISTNKDKEGEVETEKEEPEVKIAFVNFK